MRSRLGQEDAAPLYCSPTRFKPSPMFISFEGIDGSGKSTQADMLCTALESGGKRVARVREPGGTPLGESVRELLLSAKLEIAPRAELLLFSAARAQLVEDVIKPALTDGYIVVADRFYDSTIAYQGFGRGVASQSWLEEFNSFAAGGLEPDRTYLMILPVTEAQSRRAKRADKVDRMEAAGTQFYTRVVEGYLAVAKSSRDRVLTLDSTEFPESIHQIVLRDAWSMISNKKDPASM